MRIICNSITPRSQHLISVAPSFSIQYLGYPQIAGAAYWISQAKFAQNQRRENLPVARPNNTIFGENARITCSRDTHGTARPHTRRFYAAETPNLVRHCVICPVSRYKVSRPGHTPVSRSIDSYIL